jgi:hypothetical protein
MPYVYFPRKALALLLAEIVTQCNRIFLLKICKHNEKVKRAATEIYVPSEKLQDHLPWLNINIIPEGTSTEV